MPVRRLPRRVNPALARGKQSAKAAEVVKRALPQRIEAVNPEDMDDGLRMAGSRILEELGNEYENERQEDYIGEQLGRFVKNDRMFERAGVPVDVAPTLTDTLGQMHNGAPMPFVDTSSKQGVERRVHTRFEMNPYTNEFEIVPFVDVDTGGALVSEFGDSRVANIDNFTGQRGDKATEYVAERILKLMGLAPRRGPFKGVDFQVDMGGKQVGIDAQIQREDKPTQTQLYTYLRPQGVSYNLDHRGGQQIQRDVAGMIRNAPNASTSNLVDVIEGLANNGKFNDVHNNRFGKALKDDYDYAIMPSYSAEYADKNQSAWDTITEAPNSIAFVNLEKAMSNISNISAKEAIKRNGQARISYNKGDKRQGPMRARINIATPDEAIRDAVAVRPYAAQMLKELI